MKNIRIEYNKPAKDDIKEIESQREKIVKSGKIVKK